MTDDLNQRVQARLVELASMESTLQHDKSDSQHQLMWFLPAWGLALVESWRERWERHQPVWDVSYYWCHHCRQSESWLCPDALAVLREIGVEP